MRNEHLLSFMPNPDRQVTPNAASSMDNLYDYVNAIVKVQLPPYFYAAWTACRLVAANKWTQMIYQLGRCLTAGL